MGRQIPTYGLPPEASPEPPSRPPTPVIYLLGIVGGVAGILAAVYQELLHGGLLAPVLVGPAIEEACKPLGLIFMLEKRPHWLRSRAEVVVMAVLGALVFATLENVMYVHVYHPDGGAGFVAFRYTVCTGMHLAASAIFGLGLAKLWQHMRREGGGFDIDRCLWYYAGAAVLHGAYNGTVILLEHAEVLKF